MEVKMQTFLPYKNFKRSAKCLDYKRLGKQRIEAWQIYLALTKKNYGWKNHPIVKMWKSYESALLLYGMTVCIEWSNRGYKDKMFWKFANELINNRIAKGNTRGYPKWLGNKEFHNSHKSNLLRKNSDYYKQFNWNVPNNLPYIWNVN